MTQPLHSCSRPTLFLPLDLWIVSKLLFSWRISVFKPQSDLCPNSKHQYKTSQNHNIQPGEWINGKCEVAWHLWEITIRIGGLLSGVNFRIPGRKCVSFPRAARSAGLRPASGNARFWSEAWKGFLMRMLNVKQKYRGPLDGETRAITPEVDWLSLCSGTAGGREEGT